MWVKQYREVLYVTQLMWNTNNATNPLSSPGPDQLKDKLGASLRCETNKRLCWTKRSTLSKPLFSRTKATLFVSFRRWVCPSLFILKHVHFLLVILFSQLLFEWLCNKEIVGYVLMIMCYPQWDPGRFLPV